MGCFFKNYSCSSCYFFINSLCHYVGGRTYDFTSTARDSWFVSLFTFGEGYHNYHHKFQWDYRNGIKWFAFDPSKWIIKVLSYVGITYDLKVAQDHLIWESKINSLKAQLNERLQDSSASIKSAYNDRLNNLNTKAKDIIESWRNMELKYLKDKDNFSSKMIEKFKNDKITYQNELKSIFSNFKAILSNIKKNRVSTSLINS